MTVIKLDPEILAEINKKKAVAAVDEWFAEQVATGFTAEDGFVLGLSDADVVLLTGNYVLAKEADAAGLSIPAVIDASGSTHVLSMEELTALMLAYGSHRAALSQQYAERKAAALASGG